MDSPICPYCGCSLARLGITRDRATAFAYKDEQLLFCCQGCLDGFQADPERAPVSSHSTSAPGVTLPARGMGSAASTSVRCSTESAMMNAAIR